MLFRDFETYRLLAVVSCLYMVLIGGFLQFNFGVNGVFIYLIVLEIVAILSRTYILYKQGVIGLW